MPPSTEYPYKVVGTGDGGEIRKFADQRIASSIDAAIADANLTADKSTAIIVTYRQDQISNTIRGAVMKRMETTVPSWVPFLKTKKVEWSFAGVVAHDFTTGNTTKEAGVVIRL